MDGVLRSLTGLTVHLGGELTQTRVSYRFQSRDAELALAADHLLRDEDLRGREARRST